MPAVPAPPALAYEEPMIEQSPFAAGFARSLESARRAMAQAAELLRRTTQRISAASPELSQEEAEAQARTRLFGTPLNRHQRRRAAVLERKKRRRVRIPPHLHYWTCAVCHWSLLPLKDGQPVLYGVVPLPVGAVATCPHCKHEQAWEGSKG